MSNQQPTDRERDQDCDNSLPPRPGSGPKPEFDELQIRSISLKPRSAEPAKPGNEPESPEDSAEHRLEQLKEYQRRIRKKRADD
jgi:hypothetical protein